MFDFGKVFNYWIDSTHLAHTGARYAAVGKNPGPGATLAESIQGRANTAELQNGSYSVPSALSVCVSFPDGTSKVGDPVQVEVKFTYQFMGYLTDATPIATRSVTQRSTMRIERPIDFPAHCYPSSS